MEPSPPMAEELEVRMEGESTLPTLIYLPGLHGDGTLIQNLSRCLRGRVRFVTITYPRTLTWSLADYAGAVEAALAKRDIRQGWLLGESFSSQVTWAIVGRARFAAQGIILAGGFVRHPLPWLVRPVGVFCHRAFLRPFFPVYLAYVKYFRRQNPSDPEMHNSLEDFIARRTQRDLQAIRHRLRLIAENDPRPTARRNTIPVFALTGAVDPIVPWPLVRRWLRRHCPALRDYRVIVRSDHNVLQMAAPAAAKLILQWMEVNPVAAPRMAP